MLPCLLAKYNSFIGHLFILNRRSYSPWCTTTMLQLFYKKKNPVKNRLWVDRETRFFLKQLDWLIIKNWSCVWWFWCAEICSACQRGGAGTDYINSSLPSLRVWPPWTKDFKTPKDSKFPDTHRSRSPSFYLRLELIQVHFSQRYSMWP